MSKEAREALRIAGNASTYAQTLGYRLELHRRSAAAGQLLHDAAASANNTAIYQAATMVAARAADQLAASVDAGALTAAGQAATIADDVGERPAPEIRCNPQRGKNGRKYGSATGWKLCTTNAYTKLLPWIIASRTIYNW